MVVNINLPYNNTNVQRRSVDDGLIRAMGVNGQGVTLE